MEKLWLKTDFDKPNFEKVFNIMNGGAGYPVNYINIPREKILAIENYCNGVKMFLARAINSQVGRLDQNYINISTRSATYDHVFRVIKEYYGEEISNIFVTAKGDITTKYEAIYEAVDKAKKIGRDTAIFEALKYLKLVTHTQSSMNFFFENHRFIENGIYKIPLNVEYAITGRLATNNPNTQGMTNTIKKTITAEKGRSIISLDVTGQEAHILVFGIMDNEDVKRKFLEHADCYKAITASLGFPVTKTLRSMIKVPVLAVMNGMGEKSCLEDVMRTYKEFNKEQKKEVDLHGGPRELATKVRNFIIQDPGYVRIVDKYVNENKNNKEAKRKGLFGTERSLNGGYAITRLKNGFFQVTAAEILVMSIEKMMDYCDKRFKSKDVIKIVAPIYDEVVFSVDNIFLDECKDIINNFILPKIDNWEPFIGKMCVGKTYDDGEEDKMVTLQEIKNIKFLKNVEGIERDFKILSSMLENEWRVKDED